jgi:hypothetical protein
MCKTLLPRIIAVALGLTVSLAAVEVGLRIQPWIKMAGFELSSDAHPIFHHAAG